MENKDSREKRHSDFIECVNILQRVFKVELAVNHSEGLICISDEECEGEQVVVEINREPNMTHIEMSYK